MTIMDFIRRFSQKKGERSEKFRQMQEDLHLQKTLEDRQKSANERELERIMEKRRQEQITEELNKIRKRENRDNWKGNNIFKGQKSILHEDRKPLQNDMSILKQKNIFKGEGNMFLESDKGIPMNQGGMFFK